MAFNQNIGLFRLTWGWFGKEKMRIKIYYILSVLHKTTLISNMEQTLLMIPLSLYFWAFWSSITYFQKFQLVTNPCKATILKSPKAKGQDAQDFRQYLRKNTIRGRLYQSRQSSEGQNSFPVAMNILKLPAVWWLSLGAVVKQKGKAWYRKLNGPKKT